MRRHRDPLLVAPAPRMRIAALSLVSRALCVMRVSAVMAAPASYWSKAPLPVSDWLRVRNTGVMLMRDASDQSETLD